MADTAAFQAAMDGMLGRFEEAARTIALEGAVLVQTAARALAPVGIEGNTTNPPGDLARAISVDGPTPAGDDRWEASVGPMVIYGRQREFGGDIYPQRAAALAFEKFGTRWVIGPTVISGVWGNTIFLRRTHVHQEPAPYLEPGAEMSVPAIYELAISALSDAITG